MAWPARNFCGYSALPNCEALPLTSWVNVQYSKFGAWFQLAVYISDDTVVLENCDGLGSSVSTFKRSQVRKHHCWHGRMGQRHCSLLESWHEQDMVLWEAKAEGPPWVWGQGNLVSNNNSKVDTCLQKIVNGTFREGKGDNGLYGSPFSSVNPSRRCWDNICAKWINQFLAPSEC